MTGEPEVTLRNAVVRHLKECHATPDGVQPPAAILWTDPEGEWRPLAPAIRRENAGFFTFGPYDAAARTGPAIWLRCVLEGTADVPEEPPADSPLIFYLPGVGRQELRAGEECPAELQPLVELMYRGTLWLQRNGRDWTLMAFLTSKDTLGLDIGRDQDTRAAVARALREMADTPLAHLQGRHLEADDFDRLLTADLYRDLLRWIADPHGWKAAASEEQWTAFRNQCRSVLEFDPAVEGETGAGRRLGEAEGAWAHAWARFEEAPTAYPGIPDVLRRSRPNDLFVKRAHWPSENEAAETALRSALKKIPEGGHGDGCERILGLEAEHAERRDWIWYRLGHAPLAGVLEHLAVLARYARSNIGGSDPDDLARVYVEEPWRADAAAWQAIACCPTVDEDLIQDVIAFLLRPWLDETARELQRLIERNPLTTHLDAEPVAVTEGGCLLFADGLRYDLGRLLAERLEGMRCRVRINFRWAGLPTVTATAKPAVTPLVHDIAGADLPENFAPFFTASNRGVDAALIRSGLEDAGYQVLTGDLGDWPASDTARGWAEAGRIDNRGHKLGVDLARQLDAELDRLAERVIQLLDAGWATVRVVTDHGWLLMPGGLPKIDLPRHLTESRWSRAATIVGESTVAVPTVPWYWNPREHFATPPGIACFNTSPAYAHGGISLQECVIPDLTVEREGGGVPQARIVSVSWQGLRCVVQADGAGEVRADLRLGGALGPSVVTVPKPVEKDKRASLLLAGDEHEHDELTLVLMDADGTVLAQQTTRAGEAP